MDKGSAGIFFKLKNSAQGVVEYALILAFVVILITAIMYFSDVKAGVLKIFDSVGNVLTRR